MADVTQADSGKKKIFIVGADDYNLSLIEKITGSDNWELIRTLEYSDVQPTSGRIDFDELYERAKSIIEEHGGKPDAIIGYLDFPVTSLVSLLRRDYDMPGASPEAVAKCEHKYWAHLKQKEAFPDRTSECSAINPFEPENAKKDAPAYPFWLKPVKGHSSVLGFLVEDEEGFDEALQACRQKIHLIGEPFNAFLDKLKDRSEFDGIDGNFAVAEQLISADRQFTLEGYVWQGETRIYGVVESLREGEHASSFSRYQYPADLPENVIERSTEIVSKMMTTIGYDGSPFNVEFFYDPESDDLRLLEINARISKSHSPLFHMVDGAPHQKVAIELSMGLEPDMPHREGKDAIAGKFMLRSFEADGIVKRVPSSEEIAELKRILPDIDANVLVEKDQRLSEMFFQDSYSYQLADIFLGGHDEGMLEDAYHRVLASLPIFIKPLPEDV
ncbi:ATP-grasp domain-containing protein [Idiomarina seosinensis]|uniref:ATP-grasp domain-containing protein n=1 Tax=Idiomarina seosinensis TaxID=281739 RepID=UPI00384C50BB